MQALCQSPEHLYEKREGSGSRAGSGSVPLTNGSGSGRPKNIQIRIPNTDAHSINDYQICRPLVSVFTERTSRADGVKLHPSSITFLLVVCLSVIIHTGTGRIYLYRKLLSVTSWDRDNSFSPGIFLWSFGKPIYHTSQFRFTKTGSCKRHAARLYTQGAQVPFCESFHFIVVHT